MKTRLLLAFVAASLVCPFAHANPIPHVPDSGSTLGLLVLGLLAFAVVRRKFTK